MWKISNLVARQIIDSRGNPTVEVDVWVDGEFCGRAAVPSGASTGVHEAHELRDGGPDYHGKGVQSAIENIHTIILPKLKGMKVDEQRDIDQRMIDLDGTENKSSLGANAILAVSLAVAHAAAHKNGVLLYSYIHDLYGGKPKSLPVPMMNILNGGKHASNSSDFQEFMIMPKKAESYAHAMKMGVEVFQQLRETISKKGGSTAVGDEGGFTFPVSSNAEMLDMLMATITDAGYQPGEDIGIALDIAASEFYENNQYTLGCEDKTLSSEQMIDYAQELSRSYPIISIEDALDEDDWSAWQTLNQNIGQSVQLVGDDLLVTNPGRLKRAIDENAANAILIKLNQIGTLTETLHAIRMAHENNWQTIISHRSGETEDTTIVHLAIGTGAGQIKTGSLSRSERTAKHNELMRIESIDSSLKMSQLLP